MRNATLAIGVLLFAVPVFCPAAGGKPPLLDGVPDDVVERVERLLERATVSVKSEAQDAPASSRALDFFLDRLDITAQLVRDLEIDDFDVAGDGAGGYAMDDRNGATGTVALLHRAEGVRVYLGRGRLEVPFLPSIPGDTVLVLRYEDTASSGLDITALLALRVDAAAVHQIAAFRPLRRILQREVRIRLGRVVDAAIRLCEMARSNPDRLRASASRSLDPEDHAALEAALPRTGSF